MIAHAKRYHEHMMRMRPITDDPKSGQRIEVFFSYKDDPEIYSDITVNDDLNAFNESCEIGWRPAPMPAAEARKKFEKVGNEQVD